MNNEALAALVLWSCIIAAVVMNGIMVQKTRAVDSVVKGVIKTRQHLLLAKEAINLSMKLAIYYLVMCGAMLAIFLLLVSKGLPFMAMMGKIFLFGIVTLPIGLIAKHFEKKIKNLRVESDDPSLSGLFSDYLSQWERPQFQIKE